MDIMLIMWAAPLASETSKTSTGLSCWKERSLATLLLESKRKRGIKDKEKLRDFDITSEINISITSRVITPVRLQTTKILIMMHTYSAVLNKVGFLLESSVLQQWRSHTCNPTHQTAQLSHWADNSLPRTQNKIIKSESEFLPLYKV